MQYILLEYISKYENEYKYFNIYIYIYIYIYISYTYEYIYIDIDIAYSYFDYLEVGISECAAQNSSRQHNVNDNINITDA